MSDLVEQGWPHLPHDHDPPDPRHPHHADHVLESEVGEDDPEEVSGVGLVLQSTENIRRGLITHQSLLLISSVKPTN